MWYLRGWTGSHTSCMTKPISRVLVSDRREVSSDGLATNPNHYHLGGNRYRSGGSGRSLAVDC
jgi:hypothetical protein